MIENQKIRPAQVVGPLGEPLTVDSLPPPETTNYPVREYVAALATELATMARWDGDERLASALDAAADMARRQAPAT